jgi:hypothetical protein
MRVMHLPNIPVPVQSHEAGIKLYLDRLSMNCPHWPDVSALLTAYMAWPNDEERRNGFVATCLARSKHQSASKTADSRIDVEECASIEMFGGVDAIAAVAFDRLMDEIHQLQRRWLLTADIFQLIVDMASDERAVLRGVASVSKAVDLCENEQKLPGHSQLRAAWSEFRDVAHLLAASAYLAHEGLARADFADASSVLNAIWLAPDIVLTFAYGLQEFGLLPKPIEKEPSVLRADTVWRIPDDHKPESPFIVFRRLTEPQKEFLISRRVA